jgi:chemotaxis regulatin CheY-phosphate phosphatase CheZ
MIAFGWMKKPLKNQKIRSLCAEIRTFLGLKTSKKIRGYKDS